VIGGLVTSTFLSLLIIPVVFTFVDDLIEGVRRLLHRPTREQPGRGTPAAAQLETKRP